MSCANEKRRHARLDIALSVSYAVESPGKELSERAEAISSDISASGLRLMTPGPLQAGSVLDLEIRLLDEENPPIHAQGEVVWQSKISDTSYETGAVIMGMEEEDKKRFMGFVFDQMSRFVGTSGHSPKTTLH